VSVVSCQVEVSATDWSVVQRSPPDCGASLCVISKNLVNEEAVARVGLQRHLKRKKNKKVGQLFYSFLTTYLTNRFVYLILEDGTDRLFRNVGKELLLYAA
jgi:hypothetical protein